MPILGETFKDNNSHTLIWHACIKCGHPRWVRLVNGQPQNRFCIKCSGGFNRTSADGHKYHHPYTWVICPSCHEGRLVDSFSTRKANFTGRCKKCHDSEMGLQNHPQWKGGMHTNQAGYVIVKNPEHPRSDPNGYVKRARLVLEQKLGRQLLMSEDIHHINGIKNDDRPENLIALSKGEHMSLHMRIKRRESTRQVEVAE